MSSSRRRVRMSITARVAVTAALLAVVLLTAGAFGVRAALYATQLEATQQLAAAEATQITDALLDGVQLYGPFGSLPYVLMRSDGSVIASSSEDDPARMPPPPADATQTSGETWDVDSNGPDGARTAVSSTLRASSLTGIAEADLPGGPALADSTVYRAYVFVTPVTADRVVAALDPFLLAGVAVAVALIAAAAAISAKRALRPVEQMRAVAASVSDTPHGVRVEVPQTRDELYALACTLNGMLARIDAAATGQRRFIADAAHELRSPLNTLLATVEIARAHPAALAPDRTLATVEAQARRLADLAEDLLDLTTARTQGTPDATCDVVKVAYEVMDGRSTRVPVTLTASAAPVFAAMAPQAFTRVVVNLLDNALRYAATGVDVHVGTDSVTGTVRIAVSNDGVALAAEDRERVFEPFVRLDPSRTRETGGTGLGLAITRELIHGAGGTIELTSTQARTTFTVILPNS